ncbi:hypothetical protein ACFQFR_22215 [Streptomyces goshikiensis]
MAAADSGTRSGSGGAGAGGPEPTLRVEGGVHGSAFSIGGSHHTNTVHHGGTGSPAVPGAAELLEAVLDLRAALVRAPGAPTGPRSTPNSTRSRGSWTGRRRSGPGWPPGCARRWSGGLRWWNR